ncbi:hypothetical protein GGQ85_003677 [Nitrobacter vulgaris]|nr:hypothetical protein [Nitrobacter vulgaris]
MSLAAQKIDDTRTEFEIIDRPVSAKQDLKVVADDLSRLVSRAVEANRWTLRSPGFDEHQTRDNLTVQSVVTEGRVVRPPLDDRISTAIVSALRKPPAPLSISLEPLQEWEGYVSTIAEGSFTARLVDKTKGNSVEDEEADFPIDDLTDEDRQLLVPGAVFRWVIGYQRTMSGTKRRVSQITFRRLPAWTRRELQHARSRAEEMASTIQWD